MYDKIIAVEDADAFAAGRQEGVLAGISFGTALWAASSWQNAQRTREHE